MMIANAAKLFTGNALGYALTAGFGFLIASLTGPEPYGHYLTCIAIASFIAEISHARLDMAFVYANQSGEQWQLWRLALLISLGVFTLSITFFGLYKFFYGQYPWSMTLFEATLILLIAFWSSQHTLLMGLTLAAKDFYRPAIARTSMAMAAGITSVFLWHSAGIYGLLIAQLISYVLGCLINSKCFINAFLEHQQLNTLPKLTNIYRKHNSYIYQVLPGSLLFLLTWQLHLFLAPLNYSAIEVGLFGLAFKLTTLITSLLSAGFCEPIRLEFLSCLKNKKNLIRLLSKRTAQMAVISATSYIFALSLLYIATHFSWISQHWKPAASLWQYLIPAGVLWTTIIPVAGITHLGERKETWLIWHLFFLISVATPWFYAYFYEADLKKIALIYGFSTFIFAGLSFVSFYRIAMKLQALN